MNPLRIHIPREPWKVTAQQKSAAWSRGGHVHYHHKPGYQAAEGTLVRMLKVERKAQGNPEPILEACVVSLTLVWPYRKSEKASVRTSGLLYPHGRRPDLDNLSKLYTDALVKAGFLQDDGLISTLILAKFWGPEEKVGIHYGAILAPVFTSEPHHPSRQLGT